MENILPENVLGGFGPFLKLDSTKRRKLVEAITQKDSNVSIEVVMLALGDKLNISKDEITSAFEHFAGLIIIKEASQVETHKFIQLIIEELEDLKTVTPEYNKQELTQDLEIILNTNSIFYISVKSRELNQERERLLNNVRIITDLRPVFTDAETCELKKMSIIHTLKIIYEEGDYSKERFFALDSIDLEKLKKQIERAIEKENKLREKFNGSII